MPIHCRYFNFISRRTVEIRGVWTEVGVERPRANLRLMIASKNLLTEPQALNFCTQAGLSLPYTGDINDNRGTSIYDLDDSQFNYNNGANKCIKFAATDFSHGLQTFSPTGSSIIPEGKILWLTHPKDGWYLGQGYPREHASAVSQAFFIADNGLCHENAPAYHHVDPSSKFSAVCVSDTAYFPQAISSEVLGFDCGT